jgi:dipeptidyl aminopeptidase/acylaminoacyl peptidase
VHLLDLASGADVRVGFDPSARHELQPKFSPDGRSILFVRFLPGGDAHLVIAAADGTDVGRQVGPALGWSEAVFEFSPDGRKVLISLGVERRLQIIDVESGTVETGEFGAFPSWQRRAPGRPVGGPCGPPTSVPASDLATSAAHADEVEADATGSPAILIERGHESRATA